MPRSVGRQANHVVRRLCRRLPSRRGHRLGKVREHEIERDADALGRAVVGGNVVPQPGREYDHATGLRLLDGRVGGDSAQLTGPRHDRDRPRILEYESRAAFGCGDVIDTTQVIVRVIVRGVVGAGRIDVGPAAGDHHRILFDVQVLRDALCCNLDQLGEIGEGRTRMQIM